MQKPRERSTKDCSLPIVVRPEFGPESDTRTILQRYGGIPIRRNAPQQFTETDHSLDLTTHYQRIDEIKRAWKNPSDHKPSDQPAPNAATATATSTTSTDSGTTSTDAKKD